MVSDGADAVPFGFDELFFSRTDGRGIILSGNQVFQRISHYGWEELVHKPHNLIRHADMPKGVFFLFWRMLKQQRPIGAYVKNRAKDGRHYWVFAVATPMGDGFLSVRLKPSAPLFQTVQQEYQRLCHREHREGLTPAESAEALLARLQELGFRNYDHFMAIALGEEMAARNAALGHAPEPVMTHFRHLLDNAERTLEQATIISHAYAENVLVPLNLRVQSARLGQQGATIGVISSNYNVISSEIKERLEEFLTSADDVHRTMAQGQFLMGTALLQREVEEYFHAEPPNDWINQQQEMGYLKEQQQSYSTRAVESLREMAHTIQRFQQDCYNMQRLVSGLEVTRVMAKVESARLDENQNAMGELIEDLNLFQTRLTQSLKEITQINRAITQHMRHMLDTVH